jgi:exopolyphosphatase / guanosine-5'-triphosphate,3'-diphosphate pyrophosphatase
MGEPVAPSPQDGRGGKRSSRTRRKHAANSAGKKRRNAATKAAHPAQAERETASATGPKVVKSPAMFAAINTTSPRNDRNGNARTGNTGKDNAGKGNGRSYANPRSNWIGRTAYAALDLGTNNCRLLIARAAEDSFTVVDAFSRVVRLGEGLSSTGRMSDEAMDRALEALLVCADKLKRRNVVLARSVATEACRQAVNGAQFIERVRAETGIMLDIISPKEEARLAVMGCYALLEEGEGPSVIFDIGGGSTELVLVSTDSAVPEILDWVSVPWGVVSLTESEVFDQEDAASRAQGYAGMRSKVSASFAAFAARLPKDKGDCRLLGTSGTVTTLASVHLGLKSYNRKQVDGLLLPSAALRGISQTLAHLPPAGRAEFPTIGTDRADLVVAGCAILEAILDIWPSENIGIADRGIREGILRALMASDAKRKGRN